jgi:hypothetical protein
MACATVVLGSAMALAAQPPWSAGEGVTAFLRDVDVYAQLHRRVESALPPLRTTPVPWLIEGTRQRLAAALVAARPGAHEGQLFNTEVAALIRASVFETLGPGELSDLQDGPDAICKARVNEPLPANVNHYVPGALLRRLPALPGELEYRIVGSDLVLWDVDADLVIDVLRGVFAPLSYS